MISALSLTETTRPIKLPPMPEGIVNGITVNVWVRRTGTSSRQRIIQFGTATGEYFVLGTGDNASSLAIGIERGATRSEMVCDGALPINRWVKVSAMWFPLFQLVSIAVFDITLEQQQIGVFPTGPLVDIQVAGGVAGSPFVGTLSELEILQLPVPKFFGAGDPAVVWGKYPLSSAAYQKTVTTNNVAVKYYSVPDLGPKNNSGVVEGELGPLQFADGFGLGSVPVLEMAGDPKTLFLSPVQNLSGALTLETWFNPSSTKEVQSMIILSDEKDSSLVVTVGGSPNGGGNLDVVLCKGNDKLQLLSCAYGENAGTFQHVAVSFGRGPITNNMVPILMTLYLNGQVITSRTVRSNRIVTPTFGTGAQFLPLLRLMHSKVIPHVRLGGTISGYAKFKGQLSEFRIWNSCRSASEIAGKFLFRLVGNEAGLLACYRLEQSLTGCVFDISDSRGVGTLQPGCTIGTANNLPLPHTSNPSAPHLRVKGKLVTEHMVYMADVVNLVPVTAGSGGIVIEGSTTIVITQEQRSEKVTVFDALLEPVVPDGSSQAGKTLQICPDTEVRVYVANDQNVYVPTKWPALQTQSLTVPASGKLRLRFEARALSFPTLRARYSEMDGDLWTLVRPDTEAMLTLAATDGYQLRNPPPGKGSLLPAGSTVEDATTCGTALLYMGRCYRPIAYSAAPITGEARGILGDVVDAFDSAVDWTVDTASSAGSQLKKAGSKAGRFAEALVDDGTVALGNTTATIKKASTLLCSAVDELRDLSSAAMQAVPRFGKDQLKQCIATADRLAVISTAAVNTISHTFTVIGTTIVNGVTYAWRVVASGVMDAYAAIAEFLQKVGAEIDKVLKYLAWLFNWGAFLSASDKIYNSIDIQLGKAKEQINKLSDFKPEISKYLTLPSGVGNKSLAEHCGISVPDNLGTAEIDYVMDIANTVMSSTSFNVDFMSQYSSQVGSTQFVDKTKLQTLAESLSGKEPSSVASNPVALLTTPMQQLLNGMVTGSQQTSVVDFLFEQLTTISDTILSTAKTMLTARLSVPNVTSWVESTILGGRTLSLLRIASLVAGIAQVLAVKIAASAKSGKAQPQPVSFADESEPSDYSLQIWSNFALGVLLALVQIPRALIDLAESKAADTDVAEKAMSVKIAVADSLIGLVLIARCGLTLYSNARLPKEIQTILAMASVLEALSGGALILLSWSKAYFWSFNSRGFVKFLKVVEVVVQFLLTGLSVLCAVAAASLTAAFTTARSWTEFGLQMGSLIMTQGALMTTAAIDLNPKGSLPAYTPVALAVVATVLDLGSGITNVV